MPTIEAARRIHGVIRRYLGQGTVQGDIFQQFHATILAGGDDAHAADSTRNQDFLPWLLLAAALPSAVNAQQILTFEEYQALEHREP